MQTRTLLLVALLVGCTVGCVGPRTNTTLKKGGKIAKVKLPETTVVVEQGQTAPVLVTVERENFEGPIDLKFNLPEYLRLKTKDPQVPEAKNEVTITIVADKDAKVEERTVNVTASSDKLDAEESASFKLKIKESADTKAAKREKFVSEISAKLDQAEKTLKEALKNIAKIKDVAKTTELTKDYSKLGKQLEEAKNKFEEKIKDAKVEAWEASRQSTESQVEAVVTAVNNFADRVKKEAK